MKATSVNRQQAKRILIGYRPGIDDDSDAEVKEALRLVETDEQLRKWLEHQRAWHGAIRAHLNKIHVPPDLAWQILAQRRIAAPLWRRREFLVAAAAACLLLLAISAFWWRRTDEESTFAAFRSRMVRFAVREYRMDIVTNDATEVRQFLAKGGAPADYTLPRGLESRPVIGGARLSWQGHPVSMVCLSAETKETLFLFVVNRTDVRDGTAPAQAPEIVSLHRLNAAAWTLGDRIYLLAAPLEEPELRKLL